MQLSEKAEGGSWGKRQRNEAVSRGQTRTQNYLLHTSSNIYTGYVNPVSVATHFRLHPAASHAGNP